MVCARSSSKFVVSRISSSRLSGNQPKTSPVTLKIPSIREGLRITVFHIPDRNSLRNLMQIRWQSGDGG
jgi:hypothetical protein